MTPALILPALPLVAALGLIASGSARVGLGIARWVTLLALPAGIAFVIWQTPFPPLSLVMALAVWLPAVLSCWTDPPGGRAATVGRQIVVAGLLIPLVTQGSPGLWLGLLVVATGTLLADSGHLDDWQPDAPHAPLPLPDAAGLGPATDTDPPAEETAAPVIPPKVRTARSPLAGPGTPPAAALLALGLVIHLFGVVTAASDPVLAAGCRLIGLAALLAMLPALVPLLVPLMADVAAPTPVLLFTAGLGGLALVALLTLGRTLTPWTATRLAHAALAAAAFGLGNEAGAFAALVLVLQLTLADTARVLATRRDATRAIAALGLAGVPPFGTFAGLALVLPLLGQRSAWLLPVCVLGIAVPAGALLRQTLPLARMSIHGGGPVWIATGTAILLGLAMPATVADWLRASLQGLA
jgi:hypothetical protein